MKISNYVLLFGVFLTGMIVGRQRPSFFLSPSLLSQNIDIDADGHNLDAVLTNLRAYQKSLQQKQQQQDEVEEEEERKRHSEKERSRYGSSDGEKELLQLPSFTDLVNASGSDKFYHHHYEHYYERVLPPYRHRPNLKFLEIGADTGVSIDLWERYFTSPELIVGLAYKNVPEMNVVSAGKRPNTTAVEIVYGDQSKKATVDRLATMGPWDIIIDDGSHVPQHVMYTFSELWKTVKRGGHYIIEDIETSYWMEGSELYGYYLNGTGFDAEPRYNVVQYMKQFVDVLIRRQVNAEELSIMDGDDEICSIEFGYNIMLLRKCGDEDSPQPAFSSWRPIDRERMNRWMEKAKSTHPKKDGEGNLVID